MIRPVLSGFLMAVVFAAVAHGQTTQPAADDFASSVDLTAFGNLAIHTEGRVKSYDSFAHGMMRFVSGRHKYEEQSPAFTYLDLMLRPHRYQDADVIYIKNKALRADVIRTLRESATDELKSMNLPASAETLKVLNKRLAKAQKTGLISPLMLQDRRVLELLARAKTDLRTTAKFVDAIETAMAVMQPRVLQQNLRFIATPGGDVSSPWITIDALAASMVTSADVDYEGIIEAWGSLQSAWARGDAAGVNNAATSLAELVPQVDGYPEQSRLRWESFYFAAKNFTWVWLIYALSIVPLLLAVVFRWSGARWVGLTLFVIAFGFHTVAIMLRFYVAGRWPNSNMFEAITTSAWFGGCAALILEFLVRKLPPRGLFALASAVASMLAIMATQLFPLSLSPDISNRMPVLHDIWIYIHTNVIIFSYCLIALAAVTSVLYLLYRAGGFGGPDEYARVGGAGSLIMQTPDGQSYMAKASTTIGQVLDGATMILMELSFVMLWAGIVMGAIWADHSWGRPWGWDPKEVFALNTFLVFLVLVHVRLKVRDKGLWTALLALVGAVVMMFNWIVINFTIAGLHSYA
jgi:cytochrome c-type biogenesis protein CcsB